MDYTYEDINVQFSYLLKHITWMNIFCLADLMKALMDSQETMVFISKFAQEVANFKSYVKNFNHDGLNKIVGPSDMHLIKFYVEEKGDVMGWLIMRYKKSATNTSWLPAGDPVHMWTVDEEGKPCLLVGDPKPVPFVE